MKIALPALLVLIALIAGSLLVGGSGYGWSELIGVIQSTADESVRFVFVDVRLPRTILAMLVGASLGVAGVLLQTLLQNPLAEPYTLGLSGGSSLGAILALLAGIEPLGLTVPAGSFAAALLVTALIARLAASSRLGSRDTLILSGVMVSLFCGSIVILLLSFLQPHQLQAAILWMTGQVGTERDAWWPAVAGALALSLTWALSRNRSLDSLLLGQELPETLGINVPRLRVQIVLFAALLTAVCVASAGLMGFVGLLAPHLSLRLQGSPRHRGHLVASALLGAALLLAADVFARVLGGETEVPAGGLIAVFGAPTLIALLLRERSSRHA